MGFGAMEVTKPCEFTGSGAMEVTQPYEFIGFGAMEVTKTLILGVWTAPVAPETTPPKQGAKRPAFWVGFWGPLGRTDFKS